MNDEHLQTAPRADESPATSETPTAGEKIALAFTGADKALIFGMLVCGFLFWEWVMSGAPALGVSLFTLSICGVTLLYFGKCGLRPSREGIALLAVLGLSCVQFAVFDTTPIQFFNLVFAALAYLYWISVSSGTRLTGGLSGCIVFDMVAQCITVPFGNIDAIFVGARRGMREMKRGKEFVAAALGLLVFLPLLAVVLSLLTEADDAFGAFWNAILLRFHLPDFFAYATEFVLGIPVAAYLYGAAFGNARRRRTDVLEAASLSRGLAQLRIVPNMAFCAPMAAFNACYALFFAALSSYLFSAFAGRLPEAVSYAEYARKGFFELCWVAAINLAIIVCAHLLIRRAEGARPRALRVMTGIMSAFTLLLIATAMSKMLLYISSYGLTRLRVYTSWFMLLLFLVFLLILLWHFRAFDLAKPLILVFAVCFIALTWLNADGLIAKYNIGQYLSGKTDSLDVHMLGGLSDAAAPHLYAAWEKEKDALPAAIWERDLPEDYVAAVRRADREESPDDPQRKAEREFESTLIRLRAAMEAEADPRAKTTLALGEELLSRSYPHQDRRFNEQNLQSHRAAALYDAVFRELSEAFADGSA